MDPPQASAIQEPASPGAIPATQQSGAVADEASLLHRQRSSREEFLSEPDPALPVVGNSSAANVLQVSEHDEPDGHHPRRASRSPTDPTDEDTDEEESENRSPKRRRWSPGTTELGGAPSAGQITAPSDMGEGTTRGRDVSTLQRQMEGASGDHVAPEPRTGMLRDASGGQDSPPTRSTVSELSSSTVDVTAPSYPFGARSSSNTAASGGSLTATHGGYSHAHQRARSPFLHAQLGTADGAGPSRAHHSQPQRGRSLAQSRVSEQGRLTGLRLSEDASGGSPRESSSETSPSQLPTHDDATDRARLEHGQVEQVDRFEQARARIYNAFVALAHLLEGMPQGMTRSEINRLRTYKFAPKADGSDEGFCVVCQYHFEAKERVRVLPCSHEFHVACVDTWLQENSRCPICRQDAADGV